MIFVLMLNEISPFFFLFLFGSASDLINSEYLLKLRPDPNTCICQKDKAANT